MNTFLLRLIFCLLLLYCHAGTGIAQVCDNQCLAFDGNDDYITLSPLPISFSSNPVFTAEAWFYANAPGGTNCVNGFRRLFSFSGGSSIPTFSVLDIGLCNSGLLHYKYSWGTGGTFSATPISNTPVTNDCHHIAVTYSAQNMQVYLDGALINTISFPSSVLFEFNTFQVGHSPVGAAGEDWDGQVDEIRLWKTVRSLNEIRDFKDCTLGGSSADWVAYWPLDQGLTPGGPNPAGTQALDVSGNLNHGVLSSGANGFDLTNANATSNFICNTCAPLYVLDISDQPALFPILLTTICSGDPVHICVTENANPIGAGAGTMVVWESSDGTASFAPDPALSPYAALGYTCFRLPSGVIVANNCATSTTGYEDRRYRAKIKKTMGALTCTYTTSVHDLRICCPVTNAVVQTTVQAPLPFNGNLCEDPTMPVTIDVSLTGPSFLNNLTIQWCLNGSPISGVGNVTSFTYTGLAVWPQMCFEAKIQNCACPQVNPSVCIPVDKLPMCGIIDGLTTPPTLMPDPNGGIYDYLICPGDYAQVGMLNPPDFKNCNAVWQYHFDTDVPGTWYDLLGTTNTVQNTNILPQLSPPNAASSPYLWPPGAKCIYYRIECRPLSTPSGCDPCHSNEVRICLKTPPPTDFITGISPICLNNFTTLSLNNPGPYTYTWFWNGLQVQSGPSSSYNANKAGCYWVEISDGCQKTVTPQFCLEVCEITPIIKCPEDNPCACLNIPITISGCDSFDSCQGTGPLSYTWSWDSGTLVSVNGCTLVHIPAPGGTIYTLTVCNSLNPACCATTTLKIVPCP